jgi:hypothetical protein
MGEQFPQQIAFESLATADQAVNEDETTIG